MENRYCIRRGGRRVTASLNPVLAALLALKLGEAPETESADTAIRNQLQAWLDKDNDPGRANISQWLTGVAIDFIADRQLISKYDSWILSTVDQ